jgi:hypothetical protein
MATCTALQLRKHRSLCVCACLTVGGSHFSYIVHIYYLWPSMNAFVSVVCYLICLYVLILFAVSVMFLYK